jgi:hypothetical protein
VVEDVFPEVDRKVSVTVLQRWDQWFGAFAPGLEDDEDIRDASVGRIHFRGDYQRTDVALESRKRVVARVRDAQDADAGAFVCVPAARGDL